MMIPLTKRTRGAVAGSLAVVLLLARGATAVTLEGDAYTSSNSSTANYGAKKTLDVVGPPASTATSNAFLRFDLSQLPPGTTAADVGRATLMLYVNRVTAAGSFDVRRVGAAWTEATITGSGAPALGAVEQSAVAVTAAEKGDFKAVDVTAAVKAWIDGSLTNNGLAVVANSVDGLSVRFDSKESTSTSQAPRLDIVLDGNVTSAEIVDGTVTGADVAPGTIANGNLANSSVTVTAGSGLSGGGTAALGGSVALSNAGVLSVGASAPLASSGGQNPSLSLTGTVPLANGGTNANDASTARGNLGAAASGANADITSLSGITGNIDLPNSSSPSVGVITKSGTPFIHDFLGTFVGSSAGNFSSTGVANTGMGWNALGSVTSGYGNVAVGDYALSSNTGGVGNTGVGINALDSNTTGGNNTAIGANTLTANSVGGFNTAVGAGALGVSTGFNNTALGAGALAATTTGGGNTASGQNALTSNTIGANNTAVGGGALFANLDGGYNTAVGIAALASNTTAYNNAAFGANSLGANTTGSGNTAVGGGNTLVANTTGGGNVALGGGALFANTTGGNNTALGVSAGMNLTTGSNNIDIANVAVAGESNTIRIGTVGTQTATYVAGINGATSSGGVAVFVNASGQLGTTTSSARFKDDVRDMGDASSGLMRLRPVTFRYKPEIDPSGLEQYGLIAEEVGQVYPDLVVYDADGQAQTVRYHLVNAMLLNEVQKLNARLAALEAKCAAQ